MIASSPSDDCKPLQLGHGRSGGCDERCGICAPWPQPLTPSPRMAVATRSPSRVRRAPLDAAGGSPGRGLPPPSTAAPKAISPCVRSLVIIEVTQQVVDIIVEPSQILGRVIRYNDPGLTCQSAPKRNPGSASNCDPHQRLRSGRPRSPWRGPARVAPCPHERRAWGGAVGPRGRSAGPRASGSVFEAPALVAGFENVAVVREAVEQRRRHSAAEPAEWRLDASGTRPFTFHRTARPKRSKLANFAICGRLIAIMKER